MAPRVFSVVAVGAFVAFLVPLVTNVHGLLCYNCYLKPNRNDCLDSAVLLEARKTYEKRLQQNDTDSENEALREVTDYISECEDGTESCVIETVIGSGQYKLMYRDCSDRQHFAVNITGTRLDAMDFYNNPDKIKNVSHCFYMGTSIGASGDMVCIRLCNEDFCNGPQNRGPAFLGPGLSFLLVAVMLGIVLSWF